MKDVKLLITDLDDTIWDWLHMWYNSFNPYFNNIQKVCHIESETLEESFKSLHRKYGSCECSYAFKELSCLKETDFNLIDGKELESEDKSILRKYYSDKKHKIRLYDKVKETLLEIKSKGTKIIGFTESNSFYTKQRLKHLNLDGLFDVIYTPTSHKIPESVNRFYAKDYWDLSFTSIQHLPEGFKKPNYQILLKILDDMDTKISDAIYIGDKLDRDIYMANQINLTSIYAEYGHKIETEAYELLKKVTHWSEEEVEREKESKANINHDLLKPKHIIESYGDLLNIFNFVSFESTSESKEIQNTHIIEIWKNIVNVQMHFNDIGIKIRNYAITIFTFVIAAIGFCLKENIMVHKFGLHISLALLLSFIGIIILGALYLMDRHWYHKLLLASVKQGISVENSISKVYPQINLTNNIKKASPNKLSLSSKFKLRSGGKLRIFYMLLVFPFIITLISLYISNNDILLFHELDYVKNHAKRVTINNIDSLPNDPGLIIICKDNGNVYIVKEVDNISNYYKRYFKNKANLKDTLNKYYSKTRIGRKELEELIKKDGRLILN